MNNVTLIVRIWLEPSQDQPIWRASVTDTRSQEKRYFQDRVELERFLNALKQTPAK